jgi:hypothetical protein
VAGALSRLSEPSSHQEEASISLISFPTPAWVSNLKSSYLADPQTMALLQSLQQGDSGPKGFSLQQGIIIRKGRLWLLKHSPFQHQVLEFIHSNLPAGHSRYHNIVHEAKANFYWPGIHKDIKQFVRECPICQENKHETYSPLVYSNPYQSLLGFGPTSQWISLRVYPFRKVSQLFSWWLIDS